MSAQLSNTAPMLARTTGTHHGATMRRDDRPTDARTRQLLAKAARQTEYDLVTLDIAADLADLADPDFVADYNEHDAIDALLRPHREYEGPEYAAAFAVVANGGDLDAYIAFAKVIDPDTIADLNEFYEVDAEMTAQFGDAWTYADLLAKTAEDDDVDLAGLDWDYPSVYGTGFSPEDLQFGFSYDDRLRRTGTTPARNSLGQFTAA